MSQNINSMLGGMPDDIEKGGMIIYILKILILTNNEIGNITWFHIPSFDTP